MDTQHNTGMPLPLEMLTSIVSHLFLKDLESLHATCKTWQRIVDFTHRLQLHRGLARDFRCVGDSYTQEAEEEDDEPNEEDLMHLSLAFREIVCVPELALYVQSINFTCPWDYNDWDDNGSPEWGEESYLTQSEIEVLRVRHPAKLGWISTQDPCFKRIEASPHRNTLPPCRFWDILALFLPMLSKLQSLTLSCPGFETLGCYTHRLPDSSDFPRIIGALALTAQQPHLPAKAPAIIPIGHLKILRTSLIVPALVFPLLALPSLEVAHLSCMCFNINFGKSNYPSWLPRSRVSAVVLTNGDIIEEELARMANGLRGPCVVMTMPGDDQADGDWHSLVIPYDNAPTDEHVIVRRKWTQEEVDNPIDFDRLKRPWELDDCGLLIVNELPDFADYLTQCEDLLDPEGLIPRQYYSSERVIMQEANDANVTMTG